jgi:hypothetical protein
MWSGLSTLVFCLVDGVIWRRWGQRSWRVILDGMVIGGGGEAVPAGGGRAR